VTERLHPSLRTGNMTGIKTPVAGIDKFHVAKAQKRRFQILGSAPRGVHVAD